ncbi:MAG: hypothetical protein INH11_19510, partial [Gemmatimonas sp.]|nr:hypothetical protein [Gemmatimonas sp.]
MIPFAARAFFSPHHRELPYASITSGDAPAQVAFTLRRGSSTAVRVAKGNRVKAM